MNIDALSQQLVRLVDVPSLVLALLMVMAMLVACRAQKRADFDWAGMLRDDGGKESALRLAILVAIAVSSWVLMRASLSQSTDLVQILWAYLIAWSGAPVIRELAAKWTGTLPWSKP